MKVKKCVGILCCIGILLSGCGVTESDSQSMGNREEEQTVIGVYSTPGYRPGAEDISAIPYEYNGAGDFFSVSCKIRVLSEEEQEFQIQKKQEELGQLEQLKEEYPERGYQKMVDETTEKINILSSAEKVYVTEIFGSFIGEGEPENKVLQYEISQGEEKYIAAEVTATSDVSLWVSLLNTADGAYSEGILLPYKDNYEIKVHCGSMEDSFELVRQ